METIQAMSFDDHLKVVEPLREAAFALDEKAVEEPQIPMRVYLGEIRTASLATTEHFAALSAVGFTESQRDNFQQHVVALDSAQALWNAERRGGRSETAAELIETCEETRGDLLSAADLALRNTPEGQDRISMIREGEGLWDLASDLGDLALVLTDYRPKFDAIKIDVDTDAAGAAKLSSDLKTTLANEKVSKTLTGNKELRDRIYTLTKPLLEEVRAYASFAFRKDKTNARRNLFTSAYLRRKNVRAKNKKAKSPDTSAVKS